MESGEYDLPFKLKELFTAVNTMWISSLECKRTRNDVESRKEDKKVDLAHSEGYSNLTK